MTRDPSPTDTTSRSGAVLPVRPAWLLAALLLLLVATTVALQQGYSPHPLRPPAETDWRERLLQPVEVNPETRLLPMPHRLRSLAVVPAWPSPAAGTSSASGAVARPASTFAPTGTASGRAGPSMPWGGTALYAVGQAGTILASNTDGDTWQVLDSRVQEGLNAVRFSDDGRAGWAVGTGGTILRAERNGARLSWHLDRDEKGDDLWAIDTVRTARGRVAWAVGENGTVLRKVIEADAYAGRPGNWTALPTPTEVRGSTLYAVDFLDERRGWVATDGGRALQTRDGGASWQIETLWPSGGEVRHLQFARDAKDIGWAVVVEALADSDRTASRLLRTGDGGRSWTTIYERVDDNGPLARTVKTFHIDAQGERLWAVGLGGQVLAIPGRDQPAVEQDSGVSAELVDVRFDDDGRTGWALGDGGTIIQTLDGGHTWRTQANGDRVSLTAVAFAADGRRGWAVGPKGLVLHTANGGQQWGLQDVGTRLNLTALHVDPQGERVWLVGEGGAVLRSSDAGESWQLQRLAPPPGSPEAPSLESVSFLTGGQIGWAAGGRSAIVGTDDGGLTWSWLDLPFDTVNVKDARGTEQSVPARVRTWAVHARPDGARVWVAASDETVFVSTDRGRTWSRKQPEAPGDSRLFALRFAADGRSGWAVGENHRLLRSSDGGLSWVVQTLNATAQTDPAVIAAMASTNLLALDVSPDGRRVVLVGERGLVWRSTDGGERWHGQFLPSGSKRLGVWIDPATRSGWTVGLTPALARTADAGGEWQAQAWPLQHRGYPAPWYWLTLPWVLGMVWMAFRRPNGKTEDGAAAMASSDAPAERLDQDRLAFAPLARGMSRFLRNDATVGPLTLAIDGDWGTGKSSLMNLLCADLRRHGARPVVYNAWHHQGDKQLLAGLLGAVQRQALPGWLSVEGWVFRLQLLWLRSRKHYIWSFVVLTTLVAAVAYLMRDPTGVGDLSAWQAALNRIADAKADNRIGVLAQELGALAPGSAIIGTLLAVYRGLRGFGANPAVLVAGAANQVTLKEATAATHFRAQFAVQFRQVAESLQAPLVIVIDDLDRCQPEEILGVMEAVNFLVASAPCFVILAMATRQVEAALGLAFADLVKELSALEPEPNAAADATPLSPAAREAARRQRHVRQYLEKLINIEVSVPSYADLQGHVLLLERSAPAQARERTLERWRRSLPAAVPVLLMVGAVLLGWQLGRPAPTPVNPIGQTIAAPAGVDPAASAVGADAAASTQVELDLPPIEMKTPVAEPMQNGGVLAALGLLALLSIGYATYRVRTARNVVQDSEAFRHAIAAWTPVVQRRHGTPRAIKRFGNRVRYLSMLQQPDAADLTVLDGLIARLPAWVRELLRLGVPPSAVRSAPSGPLAEHRIVALGALHALHGADWRERVHALAQPADAAAEALATAALGGVAADDATLDRAERAALAAYRAAGNGDLPWPPSEAELDAFDRTLHGIRLSGEVRTEASAPTA